MASVKRIFLFILTNLFVVFTIGILLSIVSSFLGLRQIDGSFGGLLFFCFFWGMGGAFISLFISKWMAKHSYGVQIIDPTTQEPEARALLEMVTRLSKKAGLEKVPEVGFYDSPEMNAFATGPSRNNALVAVSTGLLTRMNSDEVEGVLGHELAHIANGDMVTMTLIQGVVNSFAMFLSRLIASVVFPSNENRNPSFARYMLISVLDVVLTLLGSILVFYFSRQREFRADAGGAQFAGKEKMISGLKKLKTEMMRIEGSQSEDSIESKDALATLKISGKTNGIVNLFRTHPSLEDRISRLEQLSLKS